MNKIFLGGTCNNSTWRDELIPMLKIDYFNPVVDDWTEEMQEIEEDEKNNKCNIHLYVITKEMTGVYSIAETVESAFNKEKQTVFFVIENGFKDFQVKSLNAVKHLLLRNEASVSDKGDSLRDLAYYLNNLILKH